MSVKIGDKVRMSHPGKRDGEIGIVKALSIPLASHKNNSSCDPCRCGIELDINGESWKIHKHWVEPVSAAARSCEFISFENIDSLGNKVSSVFVPRPTSFFGGWARHSWLKQYFKHECSIASPEFWRVLIERHGEPKVLIEEDGVFRIESKT